MNTISVLVFFFLLFFLMAEAQIKNSTSCETFSCRNLDFGFPFFNTNMPSRCGLFMLNCSDQNIPEIQLEEKGNWYELVSVSQANTITVIDPRLNQSLETGSCSDLSSFSLPDSPWLNLTTLYKCNNSMKNGFTYANCRGSSLYYTGWGDYSGCSVIKAPESWVIPRKNNKYNVNATFSLHIELPKGCSACHNRGGECRMIKDKFRCLGGINEQKYNQEKVKLGLGVSAGITVIIIIVVLYIICIRCRGKNARKSDWNVESVEAVVMLKRYSYAKVKKMTNSFAHVLGRGGFGIVYKGKLHDGDADVAVKILKEGKGNGEDFINEVASMSRTSHVNIVPLLGFCYEGNKRAIVYEFMPNGSLDKFISDNMSSTKMEWTRLYDIAVGVSRGLEYLHNRCVSRIVHFDIKPQNILMDKDLCHKISDFGLAKLCKNKESVLSMLDARGTVGYIAPEVFSKNFGGVSHKSDVYSYGMLILEMIGAKNIENFQDSGSNNSSREKN